jgi:hypothetical protein
MAMRSTKFGEIAEHGRCMTHTWRVIEFWVRLATDPS